MGRAGTFDDLARHFEEIALELKEAPAEAAIEASESIKLAIKETFGHAPPLADLAQSTQDDRVAQGFSANDPLVRTHQLEDSYKNFVGEGPIGVIGGAFSEHPLAGIHEHGYYNVRAKKAVPPRPAALIGFTEAQPEIKTMWRDLIGLIVKR